MRQMQQQMQGQGQGQQGGQQANPMDQRYMEFKRQQGGQPQGYGQDGPGSGYGAQQLSSLSNMIHGNQQQGGQAATSWLQNQQNSEQMAGLGALQAQSTRTI